MTGSSSSAPLRKQRLFSPLSRCVLAGWLAAAALLPASAAQSTAPAAQSSAAKSIAYKPGLTMADLMSAAPAERVVFQSGRSISVEDLRRLQSFQHKLRAAKASPAAAALRRKPDARNVKTAITTRADLTNALRLPDDDTVRLPSGKLVTAKVLKMAYGLAEQRIRRSSAAPAKRSLPQGKAVNVTASNDKAYWRGILQKPDDTVLQSPGGKRITVGELKSYLEQSASLRDNAAREYKGGRK
ncbi:hypothetical protein ACXWTF_03300 [Thiomicrolovo sp. ZZH C-3]